MQGSITKLVTSFGSRWGRIQPAGRAAEVFFNAASMQEDTDFRSLRLGGAVEFDARTDQVNGTYAENLVLAAPAVE